MRDTAPRLAPVAERRDLWTRMAMLECVGREDEWPSDWGDRSKIGQHPWE